MPSDPDALPFAVSKRVTCIEFFRDSAASWAVPKAHDPNWVRCDGFQNPDRYAWVKEGDSVYKARFQVTETTEKKTVPLKEP